MLDDGPCECMRVCHAILLPLCGDSIVGRKTFGNSCEMEIENCKKDSECTIL